MPSPHHTGRTSGLSASEAPVQVGAASEGSAPQTPQPHIEQPAAPPADRPRQPDQPRRAPDPRTVGVVGTGRVGAVLGAALARAGYPVTGAYAVSAASRERATILLPDVALRTPTEVAECADLVLLTVPDDPLPGLVAGLAAAGVFRPGQVVAHTSGRYGIGVLAPAAQAGATTLALHPAMTFTGTAMDLDRLVGCRYGVTAPDTALALAEDLVRAVGGVPVPVAEGDRVLYHAALAHGANHLVTLVADAMDLLRRAGVEDPAGALRPLLTAALDNALADGDAALTGPVARGDAGTVAAHVGEIGRAAPDSVGTYVSMARHTAARALAGGRLRPVDAAALLDVLARAQAPAAPAAPPADRVGRADPFAPDELPGPTLADVGARAD